MDILEYSHNSWLIAASFLVALIAGFTGLSLTQGLSQRTTLQKKISIAMASVALGGGIWAMHFVAMLGLQLPVLFYYDAAVTLSSALVAILVVGIALLILHFRDRTPAMLVTAGTIVGTGVLAMHYLGMAGLELCRAIYTPAGIVLAITASCLLNIAAFWIAYGKRSHRNIVLGTVCFAIAVFAVHFIAMAGSDFIAIEATNEIGPLISKEVLALGLVLISFALCGAFLLTGVTFLMPTQAGAVAIGAAVPDMSPLASQRPAPVGPDPAAVVAGERAPPVARALKPQARQIPYVLEGRTLFCDPATVAAIQAEGHYTFIYTQRGKRFCAWTIAEAEARLQGGPFLKTHRSYLINPSFVASFERLKDNAICHLSIPALARVPVSRSRLKDVREALGI